MFALTPSCLRSLTVTRSENQRLLVRVVPSRAIETKTQKNNYIQDKNCACGLACVCKRKERKKRKKRKVRKKEQEKGFLPIVRGHCRPQLPELAAGYAVRSPPSEVLWLGAVGGGGVLAARWAWDPAQDRLRGSALLDTNKKNMGQEKVKSKEQVNIREACRTPARRA